MKVKIDGYVGTVRAFRKTIAFRKLVDRQTLHRVLQNKLKEKGYVKC